MVLKTELCRFSGAKIYPGRGIRFVRADSQVFLFANSKCKRYFHNRLKPSKLTWTAMYRKQHKKDIAAEAVKKRRRATKKPYSRSIVGATLEVIQKRRTEKAEVRDAAREAALREIKERIKKTKDEKKAKKAEGLSMLIMLWYECFYHEENFPCSIVVCFKPARFADYNG
ncbi:hypothetical protein AQUCO_01300386v1 [Aquilegia coerulea]|uniref:TRASH domain-containing protein n=1 Tax=Aquilegia coerulea TaxID=218851 RepID=A0A2G5E1A8_AQUCA|nr:hypothetical protein AQUCO_01300386v1 [Aquilegia coerulea]